MTISLKNNIDFELYFKHHQQRITQFLFDTLPSPEGDLKPLHEAMRYVVLNGGKRVRPLLVYATGEALGVDLTLLDHAASAVELIHAYSLVHDDLPAMDNDDLRRGLPTCHKVYDEATAILVGDALQSLAFSTLTQCTGLSPETRLSMVKCLAEASGSLGMVGGQALDLKATGQILSSSQLELIHRLKTGALICASVQLGFLSASLRDDSLIQALNTYADRIGLCFQIQDDILNAEGDIRFLGKSVGSDEAKQKATFTTMNSLADAKEKLNSVYCEAIEALLPLNKAGHGLKRLADYIVLREH